MMSRANGRAWGDGENREHYSNQLSGQVRHNDDDDDDDEDYDNDEEDVNGVSNVFTLRLWRSRRWVLAVKSFDFFEYLLSNHDHEDHNDDHNDDFDDKVGRRSEEFENLQQAQHHKAWQTFWGR